MIDYTAGVIEGIWGIAKCIVWVLPLFFGWNLYVGFTRRAAKALDPEDDDF